MVGQIVFESFLEVVCYFVDRMVVPVISFGHWKCDRVIADVPRQKIRDAGFSHLRDQQVYLTVEATQFIGLLTVVLLVGGGVLIWYLKRA